MDSAMGTITMSLTCHYGKSGVLEGTLGLKCAMKGVVPVGIGLRGRNGESVRMMHYIADTISTAVGSV